ncbi:Oligoribonuclease [Bienertia sinuspersici]
MHCIGVRKILSEETKYMPDLASIFSHVLVDVSSVKALCIRWYPSGKSFAVHPFQFSCTSFLSSAVK